MARLRHRTLPFSLRKIKYDNAYVARPSSCEELALQLFSLSYDLRSRFTAVFLTCARWFETQPVNVRSKMWRSSIGNPHVNTDISTSTGVDGLMPLAARAPSTKHLSRILPDMTVGFTPARLAFYKITLQDEASDETVTGSAWLRCVSWRCFYH